MDNEKIKELAQKFADKAFADADMSDFLTQEHKFCVTNACIAFGNFLMETHCIVEKNEAHETLEELKEDARPVCEWDEKVVDVVTLEDTFIYLFGKELFNDNEK